MNYHRLEPPLIPRVRSTLVNYRDGAATRLGKENLEISKFFKLPLRIFPGNGWRGRESGNNWERMLMTRQNEGYSEGFPLHASRTCPL